MRVKQFAKKISKHLSKDDFSKLSAFENIKNLIKSYGGDTEMINSITAENWEEISNIIIDELI